MSTTTFGKAAVAISPHVRARIAGGFYLITFVAGSLALVSVNARFPANLIATGAYVGVTLLFYELFKPAGPRLSILAALVGILGCAKAVLDSLQVSPFSLNSLVFFGFYCLLIGFLILRSKFVPRILGALMMLGGLGWLTFVSPSLARFLSPFNMVPGIVGEGLLTLWLLVMGVNTPRWIEQARGAEGE